jgi:hypothetical protein
LELLKLEDGDTTTLLRLESMESTPAALAFWQGGRLLAALAEDGKCRIYRTSTGGLVAKISPIAGSNDWFVEPPDRPVPSGTNI